MAEKNLCFLFQGLASQDFVSNLCYCLIVYCVGCPISKVPMVQQQTIQLG